MVAIAAQNAYTLNSLHRASYQPVTAEKGGTPAEGSRNQASSRDPAVVVTLSKEAQATMMQAAASTNYYAQFFPPRDGFSATALAAAVVDPGAETISKGKTLEQVTSAARANMDEKYAAMKASGTPFDSNSWEGKDWYTLFGDLDRRALYAVSSNQGGQFSQMEQDIAKSIMSQQQGWAMGQGGGPTRLVEGVADRFMGDHAARLKAAVTWLDGVSNDEKTSVAWAASRASAQISYEWIMQDRGVTPDNLDSDNPLAQLIKSAMATMKNNADRGFSTGRLEDADDLKRQPWFKGFETQLDQALASTKELYQRRADVLA
jgi:hypothetical protein